MLRQDTLRLALAALSAHKLRTALTLTGLIIGVTSLILVMTLIQGANAYVESKIANLGADVFQVSRLPLVPVDFDEFTLARKNRDLTVDDLLELQARCTRCLTIGGRVDTLGRVRTEMQSMTDVSIRGETANMGIISTVEIEDGRFFSEGEERAAARVTVIGASVADKLFAGRNPIGQPVRVADEEFRVIGLCERIGSILGQEQDNFVIIPFKAYERIFGLRRSLIFHVRAKIGRAHV